uniref:FlgD immunoglobulin-like domain containing protein n=1 Tax=Penaeicola halotolerans TaxID=2793196 RepID=UPI001CF84723
ATATILNDKGNTARTITIDAKKGFNTIGWDFIDDSGEYIRPGKFSLKITAGNQSDTRAFEIR